MSNEHATTGSDDTPWSTFWDLDAQPALRQPWSSAQGFADPAWIDLTLHQKLPHVQACAVELPMVLDIGYLPITASNRLSPRQ